MKPSHFVLLPLALITSCVTAPTDSIVAFPTASSFAPSKILTSTPTQIDVGVITEEQSYTPTLGPDEWMELPVVPNEVSDRMKALYQRGLENGREKDHFSKLGDCQSVPSLFLGVFDTDSYELGEEYNYLQKTIDYFHGSWGRDSLAVKGGLNVAAVQTLYYTDPEHCEKSESPMVCELRVNNPSIVIISFETWWAGKPAAGYEDRLRSVVDYVSSQDIVPILATKADNLEGDHGINDVIAKIAYEYQIPLWNFWAAVDPLPFHGLSDGFHLTFAQNIFNDPKRMEMAWPWRNLTALQTIDAVFNALNEVP